MTSGHRAVSLSDEVPPAVTTRLKARIVSRRIARLAARGPFDRLLDIGCGTGEWTIEFTRLARSGVAVDSCGDFVQATREHARRSGVPSIEVVEGDARDPPVDGTCDLVTVGAVTMYVWQDIFEGAIRAARAVLPRAARAAAERVVVATLQHTWPVSVALPQAIRDLVSPPRLESWEFVFERAP